MRYDYIRRLIKGVREEIENVMSDSGLREEFPGVIRADWLDASILCDVIEQDIEFTQFANIDENIFAVERAIDKLDSEHIPPEYREGQARLLMDIADVLRSLAPRCDCEEDDIEYEKVKYVLEGLKRRSSSNKQYYANAILDWFELDDRFFVNACVFKEGMERSLIVYIIKTKRRNAEELNQLVENKDVNE